MKLLVDAGNTRLKWALCDGAALHGVIAVANADRDSSVLWQGLHGIDAVWIASVAGAAANAALERAARKRFGVAPVFVASRAQCCGVRNAYAQPEQLGVDRFLGLIAARARARTVAVIAGCGTALTLDALAADGTHLGGVIAPGPDLAQTALRAGTAQLGAASAGRIVEIADNTADAIASGTWLAAAALVERFCAQATLRLRAVPALLLTGGGAPALSRLLGIAHETEADLVLRGLALLAEAGA